MTLYQTIQQNAELMPQGIACEYFQYQETHATMLNKADAVGAALEASGIKAGDRVGICLPNTPELLHILYGVNRIGAVAVMLNPKSPEEELYRQLKMTQCKVLFFSHIVIHGILELHVYDAMDQVLMICVPIFQHLPLPIQIAIGKRMFPYMGLMRFRSTYESMGMSYKEFLSRGKAPVALEEDDQAPAVIIFSGGTNGTLKGILHSSYAFGESARACLETEQPLPKVVSMLAILPAFHIFGLTVAIHLPLTVQGKVVLVPFFNLGIMTKILIKECPAFFPGVPTVFERLLAYQKFQKAGEKGRLNFREFRHGFVGGDHLKDETRDVFNALIQKNHGEGYISMGYGMSECCPISVNTRESSQPKSVGFPFEGNGIRICREVDGSYQELPEGETGEIHVSSRYSMLSMLDENQEMLDPFLHEGDLDWYPTGDLGSYKNGQLYYECRERRLIKVSGNTIFSSSLEAIIKERMRFAKDVFVVPVEHKDRGQSPYVFFSCFDNFSDQESLELAKRACKGRIVKHAFPVGATCILPEEVPYTALGKIAWGTLEKIANERISK